MDAMLYGISIVIIINRYSLGKQNNFEKNNFFCLFKASEQQIVYLIN